ncbi:hypothetical protein LAZ67_7001948 [Cordylochernes scorpioides]|uniref:Uncharacterized protein n=1 Tax=Cordylochernes scorpioides TaxID=51811 RepID=A0ABY6KMN9_9ARAC|nr:hypothetical protein LAZ67_7001948 [Cordylochernes scorpioides]
MEVLSRVGCLGSPAANKLAEFQSRRASYKHIYDFKRGGITGLRKVEISTREIAMKVGCNQSTVVRVCSQWSEEDSRKYGSVALE